MNIENKIVKEGELTLAGTIIPCYVLQNGTRVLSGNVMQVALNMVDEDEVNKSGSRLARYLNQKSLKPFLYKDKEVGHFDPLICYKGDTKINGYEATVLADICDGFLEARKHIKLSARQEIIASKCEILMRSFAKVGIIALVDEATGYQYEREKLELQTILQAFISEEILKWQETFALSFYKEIFRLWNVPFTAPNIKRKPMFIGKLTNELVYKNMPKGYFVLDILKQKTPRTETGNFKYRLHQSLTPEAGRTALIKVINSVEALASISDTKAKFLKLMKDKYHPDLQLKLFPEIDNLAAKEDKKPAIPFSTFNTQLKGLLSVPSIKNDKK
ncbi:MAG: P63C domain-containing protein [Ferruginibacter sp.]